MRERDHQHKIDIWRFFEIEPADKELQKKRRYIKKEKKEGAGFIFKAKTASPGRRRIKESTVGITWKTKEGCEKQLQRGNAVDA